jgi:hypothetical protein
VTQPSRAARAPRPPRRPHGGDLRRAWGDDLAGYEWHHFVSLTTRAPVPVPRLLREFEQRWVRKLARAAQRPLAWFLAIEGTAAGWPHLHALIYGTRGLAVRQLERAWPLGNTRVYVYDPARGAAWYVVKHLARDPDGVEMSTRWPRPLEELPPARRSA